MSLNVITVTLNMGEYQQSDSKSHHSILNKYGKYESVVEAERQSLYSGSLTVVNESVVKDDSFTSCLQMLTRSSKEFDFWLSSVFTTRGQNLLSTKNLLSTRRTGSRLTQTPTEPRPTCRGRQRGNLQTANNMMRRSVCVRQRGITSWASASWVRVTTEETEASTSAPS